MRIDEIDRLRPGAYTGGRSVLTYDVKLAGSKPLPGGSNFRYKASKDLVQIFDPDSPIKKYLVAQLRLDKAGWVPFPNALQVDTITVDERYRGMGLAKALYGIVLSIMRVPLVAGWGQTPGGQRNWASLASIPGVEVKGYITIPDRRFDLPNPKAYGKSAYLQRQYQLDLKTRSRYIEKMQDAIMQVGGEYAGIKNRTHVFYFPVTVDPKTGILANAIKNSPIPVYTRGMNNGGVFGGEEGLVAYWTGK